MTTIQKVTRLQNRRIGLGLPPRKSSLNEGKVAGGLVSTLHFATLPLRAYVWVSEGLLTE